MLLVEPDKQNKQLPVYELEQNISLSPYYWYFCRNILLSDFGTKQCVWLVICIQQQQQQPLVQRA